MTRTEREGFRGFLWSCTDRQVPGVYVKEMRAGRDDYAEIARGEADRRGLTIPEVDDD